MMRRRRTSERGSALVEMAVVLPILVLLIHGIFYFGRGYVNKEKIEMAARYAAWEKIARPGDTVEMVKDAITEKYFKGETIQVRFISDQEECRNAARAAAGGSTGREEASSFLSDVGEAADKVAGVLSDMGGLQCAEVKYTYNPAPWGIPTYEMPSQPQPLFSPIEVKAVHAVLGDYYSIHEHRTTDIFNLASFAWDKIMGFF